MSWLTDLFVSRTASAATPADKAPRSAPPGKPQPVLHDTPDLVLLRRFIPMRDLDDDIITAIPYCQRQYQAGETICQLGETADSVIYLVRGEIEVQPDGNNLNYLLPDQSARAHLPISSGQRFGATVIAKTTPVIILAVAPEITKLWIARGNQNVSYIELSNIELPPQISNNLFFNSFARAYRENRLNLPALPDVALRLKEALSHDIGTTEAAQIIQMDAAIVTKLIQVANSPLYSPVTPIANCHDAVTRLGLSATKNLVLSISLRQLFKARDPEFVKGMQSLWKKSLFLSSLCFVLAEESRQINPDNALLAGLISDIGIIPLLHFAEQSIDQPSFKEIEAAIPYLRGPVGALVLHTLGFPEELTKIPIYAEEWFYDSGSQLSLIDIVVLAKLHSLFGTGRAADLPYINSVPAYGKFKSGQLDPDFSLSILQKAKSRISAAMKILL